MTRLTFILFLAASLHGESKTEMALKADLAASQKALEVALSDKAIAQGQLVQASRNIATLGTEAKIDARSASGERKATIVAVDANAAEARAAATAQAEATARAESTAAIQKAQTEALIATAQSTKYGMYSALGASFLTLLGVLFGLWAKDRSDTRAHTLALAIARENHKDQVEKIAEGAAASAQAIQQSNHLTQKLVDMREDIATAVQAVKTDNAVAQRALVRERERSEKTAVYGAGGS